MGKVVKFKTTYIPPDVRKDSWMSGCAAGVADCYRNGGDYSAVETIRQSGLLFENFRDAGADDYDLETLEEIYSQIGEE